MENSEKQLALLRNVADSLNIYNLYLTDKRLVIIYIMPVGSTAAPGLFASLIMEGLDLAEHSLKQKKMENLT